MVRPKLKQLFPGWKSAVMAVASAVMLILAFPDFEWWWMAWFALVPLMFAVEREKASIVRSFVTGWIFGTIFFFGTCWWLTFAPITYAGFPPPLAYSLMLCVSLAVGVFPALFAGILAVLLRRFGSWAFLAAPFIWVFTEFLRYWVTGNNWNAIGYSQAFTRSTLSFAAYGGVALVGSIVVVTNAALAAWSVKLKKYYLPVFALIFFVVCSDVDLIQGGGLSNCVVEIGNEDFTSVVAIQPNVPMAGLDIGKWEKLRQRQTELAEMEMRNQVPSDRRKSTLVILPESPMNFMYADDREFQAFINDFARRNNVSVLFNSAEPDATNGKYFNSAVMVGPQGSKVAEYDKIFLLPFGEAVPSYLEGIVPGFVGNFSYGRKFDLMPVGDAKAGIMICFESHFGELSRRYVQDGADVIIEMTNDGYLGPTPVQRQHLANAAFRAVETNRPVVRVTNVGISAYIFESGQMMDVSQPNKEATFLWAVSKSDGSKTLYVKYGDWLAWLCSAVTLGLLILAVSRRRKNLADVSEITES